MCDSVHFPQSIMGEEESEGVTERERGRESGDESDGEEREKGGRREDESEERGGGGGEDRSDSRREERRDEGKMKER